MSHSSYEPLSQTNPFNSECPYCHKQNDLATGINSDKKPDPGDISICVCGEVGMFTETGVRKMDEIELFKLMTSNSWPLVEKSIAALKREKCKDSQ